jgi:hypothetical protein
LGLKGLVVVVVVVVVVYHWLASCETCYVFQTTINILMRIMPADRSCIIMLRFVQYSW